ncbi:HupE/UreJ family protein [bacterium]|nr:HupE/UreJ family protein [bacterium]
MIRWVRRLFLLLALAAGAAQPALAHEVRPAYLEIREIGPALYDVLWKTPAQGRMRLALDVDLPSDCESIAAPRTVLVDAAVLARWREQCAEPLTGRTIRIAALDATLTDAIVRFEPEEGPARLLRLTADSPAAILPASQSFADVAGTYFGLGVEHILLGVDHLLFVLALLLLIRSPARLIGAITAFTAAHSITLAGATFGVLYLPPAPVEAAIALSIMFVAVEVLHARDGRTGVAHRWPWIVSFAFGLLHGFGFAGALHDIGLPEGAVPAALLFFNLGVEAGQLLFVAACLAVFWLARRAPSLSHRWVQLAPTYAIGVAAAYWFIERTTAIIFA